MGRLAEGGDGDPATARVAGRAARLAVERPARGRRRYLRRQTERSRARGRRRPRRIRSSRSSEVAVEDAPLTFPYVPGPPLLPRDARPRRGVRAHPRRDRSAARRWARLRAPATVRHRLPPRPAARCAGDRRREVAPARRARHARRPIGATAPTCSTRASASVACCARERTSRRSMSRSAIASASAPRSGGCSTAARGYRLPEPTRLAHQAAGWNTEHVSDGHDERAPPRDDVSTVPCHRRRFAHGNSAGKFGQTARKNSCRLRCVRLFTLYPRLERLIERIRACELRSR